jgi:hypothetical protein
LVSIAGLRDPNNLFEQTESEDSKSFTSKGLDQSNCEISVDNLMRFKRIIASFRHSNHLLISFAYRLYSPIDCFPLMPFGELRVGGSRFTLQTRDNPAFSSIISSDNRLIVGVNVNDLMEKPYIKPWLLRLSTVYTDPAGVVGERKRQNIIRFFFNNALAVKLNTIDCALMIKPSHFSLQPANGNQNFTQGWLCSETLPFPFHNIVLKFIQLKLSKSLQVHAQ